MTSQTDIIDIFLLKCAMLITDLTFN